MKVPIDQGYCENRSRLFVLTKDHTLLADHNLEELEGEHNVFT